MQWLKLLDSHNFILCTCTGTSMFSFRHFMAYHQRRLSLVSRFLLPSRQNIFAPCNDSQDHIILHRDYVKRSWWSPAEWFLPSPSLTLIHVSWPIVDWLPSPGQILPFFPSQRNTRNKSPNMLSPQTHILLSHYANHTINLYFPGNIKTSSSASLSLASEDLGRQIDLAIPPNRLCGIQERRDLSTKDCYVNHSFSIWTGGNWEWRCSRSRHFLFNW